MSHNFKKSTVSTVAVVAAASMMVSPAFADDAQGIEGVQTQNVQEQAQPQGIQPVTTQQAVEQLKQVSENTEFVQVQVQVPMQSVQTAATPQATTPQAASQAVPTDQQIADAKAQADKDAQAQQAAQAAKDQAQADKDATQVEADKAQSAKDDATQGITNAQGAADAAKAEQDRAQVNKDAAQKAYDDAVANAASPEEVAKAQAKVDIAQKGVDAAQGKADEAVKAEAQANANKADADKNAQDAQTASDKAQSDKKAQEQAKAEADKKVAEAQKAYDTATKNHGANKVEAAQKLADAKTEQAKAKGEYDTAKAAQEAGQKAVDSAKAALDKAKAESGATGVVDEQAISKGVGGFFESLMNDPSLTADQRAQAEEAYNIIVKNSLGVSWYNEDVADWWDSTSKGKFHAMSFQGLKNGITYIDAMNAIRKAHNLNTLGINLKAMAIAILNSQHGGHSEISMVENWANAGYGELGSYGGSADLDEWEESYKNMDILQDWPYTGWYTSEKHVFEDALKQHPELANMTSYEVFAKYPDIYQKTGHYLNFIDPSLNSMGFGAGTTGGVVWEGSWDAPTFSQEQFLGLVNTYINMVEGKGNTSKVEAAQRAYDEAVAKQEMLEKAASEAKQKVDEAQKKVDEAQKNLDGLDDSATLDNLKKELDATKKQADEAQKKVDAANKKVDSAAEKLVEAQQKQAEAAAKQTLAQANTRGAKGKLVKLQEQLKKAQDELAGLAEIDPALKQKLDDATAALKSAQGAYQKALVGITDAKATDKKASEVLAEKLAALKDAKAKLQRAEEALTKATEQAKGSKEAYDKLVQIKNELDNATKTDARDDIDSGYTLPSGEEDNGNAARPNEKDDIDPGHTLPSNEEDTNKDTDNATKPDVKDNIDSGHTLPSDEEDTTKTDEGKTDKGDATTRGITKSSDDNGSASGKLKGSVKLTKGAEDSEATEELGKTGASTVWATIVGSVMALLGIGGVAVASKRRENN